MKNREAYETCSAKRSNPQYASIGKVKTDNARMPRSKSGQSVFNRKMSSSREEASSMVHITLKGPMS